MPKIVGTLLIQDTEIIAQGSGFSDETSSGITIPTSLDGGGVVSGVIKASVDRSTTFSFDGGGVN